MREWGTVTLWLSPDKEETLSCPELARRLGVTSPAVYRRIKSLGPDHCLTYWPGPIPAHLRLPSGRPRVEEPDPAPEPLHQEKGRAEVDWRMARLFVLHLIWASKESVTRYGCKRSRDFLMNRNGMLEWYLECMFTDEVLQHYLKHLKEWATTALHKPSKVREVAAVDRCEGSSTG